MNNTLILTGGDIDLEFAKKYCSEYTFHIVIAVDDGLRAADRLGIIPNYILGDFDTVSPLLLYKYENMEDVVIQRFRPDKDFTDTQSAVMKAIEENSFSIHILGGTGSRIDHTLANILLLQSAMEYGIEAMIVSEKNRIRLLGNKRKRILLMKEESLYKYVSLIPLSEKVSDVTTIGMKYNLNHYDFYIGKDISMGVSNEIKASEAEVRITDGKLLLIEAND